MPVNGKMIDAFYAYVVDYGMRRDNANSELIVISDAIISVWRDRVALVTL